MSVCTYVCVLACIYVCVSVWKATEAMNVKGSVGNKLLSAGNVLCGVRRETKLPNYGKSAFNALPDNKHNRSIQIK